MLKGSPLQREEQAAAIVRRRAQGATLSELAAEFSIAEGTVVKRIRSITEKYAAENVQDLRTVQNEQLDQLTERVLPMALGGDLKAVDSMLRLMQRRAALNGMDMTPTMNVNATIDVNAVSVLPGELSDELRGVTERLRLA